MAVWELYSKRRKKELGHLPDVFTYDSIPSALRTQVVHMWDEAIGVPYYTGTGGSDPEKIQDAYLQIAKILRREYGMFRLSNARDPQVSDQAKDDLVNWFLKEEDNERVLDAIELTFKIIDVFCGKPDYLYGRNNRQIANDVIEELNTRFKEHGVGYQFTEGKLVRVDSQLIHTEAVIPALAVLRQKHFAGAQEEFLSAFEHYRHGKNEEALVDACKSFESTMKAICDKRGWVYDKNKAAASDLVNICLTQGLIPPFWQNHFAALRTVLQSGIPTARNRQGGHGSGTQARPEPPDELVGYVLHMTASTILFLSESEKRL
jgi:AbiJ N-terminal domain 4